MRRIGPFSVEGALLLTLALFLVLSVQRCHAGRDERRAERIATLEAQAYHAARASLRARRTADSLTALAVARDEALRKQVVANRNLSARLSVTLAANDSLLAADSVDVPTLRNALARTTEVASLYRDSTDVLLGSVERLLSSQSVERQAWLAEREAHAQELAAKDLLIATMRPPACRILFAPCPTRVQSVGIGAGIILLLLL